MKPNWLALALIPLVLGVCGILFHSEFVAAEKRSPETTIRTEDTDVGVNPTAEETEQLRVQMTDSDASSKEACPPDKLRERGDFVLGVVFALDATIDMRNDAVRHATADNNKVLAGVEGIRVVVELMQPEVERCALTQRVLQTDAELRLRREGITVLTSEEPDRNMEDGKKEQRKRRVEVIRGMLSLAEALTQNDSSDEHFWRCLKPLIPKYLQETCGPTPFLLVTICPAVSEDASLVVFSVELELNDAVYVRRDGALRVLAIWQTGVVAACQPSEFEAYARDCLRDCLDRFINDYLAANPKNRAG